MSFHLPSFNAHLALSSWGAQGSSEAAVDPPPAPLLPKGNACQLGLPWKGQDEERQAGDLDGGPSWCSWVCPHPVELC